MTRDRSTLLSRSRGSYGLTDSLCRLGQRTGVFPVFASRIGRMVSGPYAWVVTFHDVSATTDGLSYGTSVDAFEEAVRFFKRHFRIVPLQYIVRSVAGDAHYAGRALGRGPDDGRPLLAITFDDGRRSLLTHALPVLQKHQVAATAFLISKTFDSSFVIWTDVVEKLVAKLNSVSLPKYMGCASSVRSDGFDLKREAVIRLKSYLRYLPRSRRDIAVRDLLRVNGVSFEDIFPADLYLSKRDVLELVEAGVDIGSHSHTHEVFSLLSSEDALSELTTSKHVLEEVTDRPVDCFAFPSGTEVDFRPRDILLAKEAGYHAAFTTLRGAVTLEPGQFLLPRMEAPGGYEEQTLATFSCLLALESVLAGRRKSKLRSLRRKRERVNVLYIIDYLHPAFAGGTEAQLESTIRNADREFINPFLCILRGEAPQGLGCPVKILNVHRLLGPGFARSVYVLTRLMRREKIDVVHLHFFDSVLLGTLAAFLAGVPVTLTARRGLRSLAGLGWQTVLVRGLDRLAACVLSNSFAVMKRAVTDERIPVHKAHVIHNGVVVPEGTALAPGEAKLRLGLKPGEMSIGVVSNLRHVKGVDVFLRAAGLVARQMPLARFSVFGAGELRDELERLAAELGIRESVKFHGFTQEAFSLIPGFDAAVVSSRSEGCSNALLEYCFTGLAIVATDVGGNSEIIVDEESGLLVPSENPEALAEAVLRLARDPHLRTKLGSQARKEVDMRFQMRDALRQLWCLYWRLLNR